MKIDVLLIPMSARYADMRAAAVAADEAGFDGLWTWDHLRDPDDDGGPGVPEAMTTLAALAEATRRIMLGPLVLNVANRHPGVLANMAATVQSVSGGRLILGIGAGGNRRTPYAREQQALGLAVDGDAVRAQRVTEAIQIMRRLWAGDATSFNGTSYTLDRPAGFMRPDPPPAIIVGGFGPKMAALAGTFADGFNTQAFHPQLADLVKTARDAHAKAGRDASPFSVSVFAGFEERWLDPDSRARQMLERAGADRVILLLSPPYDPDAIRRAGAKRRNA